MIGEIIYIVIASIRTVSMKDRLTDDPFSAIMYL